MSTVTQRNAYAATPLQKTSLIVGIIFLLVGIAGFIPGLTSQMGDMQMAGHDSDALLLGVFQVSVLHNIVHLAFGVAGLLFARSARGSKRFLIVGGIIYLVILVYGLIFNGEEPGNFVPLNSADNWLHLILGIGMIALGLLVGRAADNGRAVRTDARSRA